MPDNCSAVDGDRVLADLNTLRGIGAYKTGVHKPTFSEPHMRSLEWLAEKLPEAALVADIDGIGNVLGTSMKSGPKLLAGSHLESQNFAGWLDGPLGVVYALEAARVINSDPASSGAGEVAAWCDEEGHFGSFLGSRSYVGGVTEADIDAARDRSSGRTMRDALRDVGLADRPRVTAERGRHIGYLEAHIEQGETLEGGGLAIRSSPPSSGSGNTGSALPASKITRHRPAWPFAGTPAWRWRGFASPSTIVFQRIADRARYGPPAASRSIRVRRALSRAAPKCCSRSATTIQPSSRAWKVCCKAWQPRSPRKAAAPCRSSACVPARPP